jgi:hypothetical protein
VDISILKKHQYQKVIKGPSRHGIIICDDDVAAKAGQNGSSETSFDIQHGFVNPRRHKRNSGIGTGSILQPGVSVH